MNKKAQNKIRIALIFGTRPEIIKMYPLERELRKYDNRIEPIIILTGQHREMLDQMIELFRIKPDYDLDIMKHGQSISQINSQALIKLEEVLKKSSPDLVLVQGDTTTTFSAALAAFYQKIKIGHVEAGLRTSKKYYPYPEEINRRLTTVLADYHFAPTETAAKALLNEGINRTNIFISGNTVIDSLMLMQKSNFKFSDKRINTGVKNYKKILLVTMHRRENWGEPIKQLCQALIRIDKEHNDLLTVFPVHKNPALRELVTEKLQDRENIILTDTLDYREMSNLMSVSTLILTDSGGIQEEAPALGKPVLILRAETERPEIVSIGAAKLVGSKRDIIYKEVKGLLIDSKRYQNMVVNKSPYGDGYAAKRIVEFILFKNQFLEKIPDEYHFKFQ